MVVARACPALPLLPPLLPQTPWADWVLQEVAGQVVAVTELWEVAWWEVAGATQEAAKAVVVEGVEVVGDPQEILEGAHLVGAVAHPGLWEVPLLAMAVLLGVGAAWVQGQTAAEEAWVEGCALAFCCCLLLAHLLALLHACQVAERQWG